jgi:hypothetical protein
MQQGSRWAERTNPTICHLALSDADRQREDPERPAAVAAMGRKECQREMHSVEYIQFRFGITTASIARPTANIC